MKVYTNSELNCALEKTMLDLEYNQVMLETDNPPSLPALQNILDKRHAIEKEVYKLASTWIRAN
jgi:hypothetical protein